MGCCKRDQSVQCGGKTSNGSQCRRVTKHCLGYCPQHLHQSCLLNTMGWFMIVYGLYSSFTSWSALKASGNSTWSKVQFYGSLVYYPVMMLYTLWKCCCNADDYSEQANFV
jgi:hypothetical protein